MSNLDFLISDAQKDDISRLNVAAVIINSKHEVLLCQRSVSKKVAPGAWHIPGGKVEEEETVEQAIERELSEELGLNVRKIHGYTGIQHNYIVGEERHRTIFVITEAYGKINLNPENAGYKFVTIEGISNYLEPELIGINQKAAEVGIKSSVRSQVD